MKKGMRAIDWIQLFVQLIVGLFLGTFGGTIIIYIAGRMIIRYKDKETNEKIEEMRKRHNKEVEGTQEIYNEDRRSFLNLIGKYRRKISKMKVKDV